SGLPLASEKSARTLTWIRPSVSAAPCPALSEPIARACPADQQRRSAVNSIIKAKARSGLENCRSIGEPRVQDIQIVTKQSRTTVPIVRKSHATRNPGQTIHADFQYLSSLHFITAGRPHERAPAIHACGKMCMAKRALAKEPCTNRSPARRSGTAAARENVLLFFWCASRSPCGGCILRFLLGDSVEKNSR